MGPISVTVRRGPLVEAEHRVHAVAVEGGRIADSAGDPSLVTLYRSSSKPLQALPLARERDDVSDVELAIACASHRAEPPQLEAARSLLERAPASEADLELGPQEGRGPSLLSHNCSGKHAGFLAVCRVRGWPNEGYRLASHPLQQLLLSEVAAAAEIREADVVTAVDGCGVLTFGLTLERMAHSFSRLAELDGGDRIVSAMAAHPELIGYDRGADLRPWLRHRGGTQPGEHSDGQRRPDHVPISPTRSSRLLRIGTVPKSSPRPRNDARAGRSARMLPSSALSA